MFCIRSYEIYHLVGGEWDLVGASPKFNDAVKRADTRHKVNPNGDIRVYRIESNKTAVKVYSINGRR